MLKVNVGIKVLFLDIDGVLNGHEWIHLKSGPRIIQSRAEILNGFFKKCRDVKVVVSSTWGGWILNGSMTYKGFSNMLLSHGVKCDVIGVLDHTTNSESRTLCILDWIKLNNPNKYAVLDDLDIKCENFIRTNPAIGIEKYHIDMLKEIYEIC